MPLKKKLIILFIAFTLIPLVLFGAIVFSQARNILKAVRIAQLNNVADLKKDKIETFFKERKADISSAQHFLNIRRNLPILSAYANDKTARVYVKAMKELDGQLKPFQEYCGYLDVILTDKKGGVVYVSNDTHKAEHMGKPLPGGKAFEEGKKGIYFTDIFRGKESGDRFAMLGVAPITDLRGKFAGEVALGIDMEPIYKFIQDATGLGDTGEVVISRKEGDGALFLSPLRHDPDAALKKKVSFKQKIAFPTQNAVQGNNGSGVAYDYRGVEALAAWRYIPSLRWGLVTKIEAAEAFASIDHMGNLIIFVGIFLLLFGAFAALTIAKTVTGPVRSLQKGAEAIASGDLSHRVGTNAKDEVGQLSRAFDTMTDSLEKLHQDLRHHITQLEESNKELEAFSYSVSHDLRSPLRGIDGFSLALLEDYGDKLDEQGKDYLQRVRAGSQRMAQLIDDLLNLSRVTRREMNRGPVNLSSIAKDIAEGLRKSYPERKVEFVISEGLTAKGDERLLRAAMENLFSNAWKFTGVHQRGRIEFGVAQRDGQPVYFVKDDGAGFDMTYVEKLFGPFQRLHSPDDFPGTGIGLATVQRIIHRHGGRVWIEGEVEKGATVYFTL